MARKTSIDCYYETVDKIKAPLYLKILEVIRKQDINGDGLTRGEIAYFTKTEKSTISARVKELIEMGYIMECGKRKDYFSKITANILKIDSEKENRLF